MVRLTDVALSSVLVAIQLASLGGCEALVLGPAAVYYSAHHERNQAAKGSAALRQHDCAGADADFSELIARDPDDQRGFTGRAEARLCLGRYDDSIADYTQAIAMEPKWFDYFGRGLAYKARGQLTDARNNFDSAIALNPNVPAPYIYRGVVLNAQGQEQLAQADFAKVVSLTSDKPQRLNYYAWVLATSAVSAFRDGPAAVQYATAACDVTRWREPPELDTLAAAYAEDGKFDDAIKWQKAAKEAAGAKNGGYYDQRLAMYQKHEPYHASLVTLF